MTPTYLSAVIGAVIAFLLLVIPGLDVKFAGLGTNMQRLAKILIGLAISGLIVASSCLNLWVAFPCDKQNIMEFVQIAVATLAGIAGVDLFIPLPKKVSAIRELKIIEKHDRIRAMRNIK